MGRSRASPGSRSTTATGCFTGRGAGGARLASQLCDALEARAAALGARELFLLTETADASLASLLGLKTQRFATKPARRASQVSGVTPRWRSRYFCTRPVGVAGSASRNSM